MYIGGERVAAGPLEAPLAKVITASALSNAVLYNSNELITPLHSLYLLMNSHFNQLTLQ